MSIYIYVYLYMYKHNIYIYIHIYAVGYLCRGSVHSCVADS